MKKFIFCVILALLIAPCCMHPPKDLGLVRFQVKTGEQMRALYAIEDAHSLLVSIEDSEGGVVHNRKNIQLYKMGEGFISEPLALEVGEYRLTEFLVLDDQGNIIFASPIEGSEKAYLVDDPLPIEFSVSKDEVTTVTPEVLDTEEAVPEDFGYGGFSFEVVETFVFLVSVFVETQTGMELTEAELTVTSGVEELYSGSLGTETNAIEVRDGYGMYDVLVEKEGYESYEQSFTDVELKGYFDSPLIVVLRESEEPSTLTGVVRDSVTGEPVDNTTVSFGGSSVTTGSDGAFSFDLGASSGTVSGSWGISASGYEFLFLEQVAVDASQNVDLPVYMSPIDGSGYPTRQIDLTVNDSGGIEIPDGWEISVQILNSNGGSEDYGIHYTNGGPNTFNTPTFGSDCLVVVKVKDLTGAPQFIAWARQVDLSTATTSLTLTATAGTAIDITADAIGNMGMLTLGTPYGPVDVGEWMFESDTLISDTIYNPYGYDGLWAQMGLDTSDPSYDKVFFSTSAISSIGTQVTLPALDETLGPNAGYVGFSVSYSASTGVLSFPAVSGAQFYCVQIMEDVASDTRLGQIFSMSESITLPQWLRTDLAGVTADVVVGATDSNRTLLLISDIGSVWEFPPDIKLGASVRKGGEDFSDGHVEMDVPF